VGARLTLGVCRLDPKQNNPLIPPPPPLAPRSPKLVPQTLHAMSATVCSPVMSKRSSLGPKSTLTHVLNKYARPCLFCLYRRVGWWGGGVFLWRARTTHQRPCPILEGLGITPPSQETITLITHQPHQPTHYTRTGLGKLLKLAHPRLFCLCVCVCVVLCYVCGGLLKWGGCVVVLLVCPGAPPRFCRVDINASMLGALPAVCAPHDAQQYKTGPPRYCLKGRPIV
jgi:hypothetical protein